MCGATCYKGFDSVCPTCGIRGELQNLSSFMTIAKADTTSATFEIAIQLVKKGRSIRGSKIF